MEEIVKLHQLLLRINCGPSYALDYGRSYLAAISHQLIDLENLLPFHHRLLQCCALSNVS